MAPDFESHPVGTGQRLNLVEQQQQQIERLTALVLQGLEVVEDFMPNIGNCALQDYGRLNEFLIEAERVKSEQS